MTKFNKRVYGLIGVSSLLANWNADFTGRPKSLADGTVFGSDKALKYAMKRYWVNEGEKVLYIRSYQMNKGKLQPRELKEQYEQVFNTELKKKESADEVLGNLLSAVDVENFGATFAVEDQNISLTGVVQIGQGVNQYEDTVTEIQDILSPFRNSKKEDADASSLGKKIVSNEAHYIYPFSVNPQNYDEYIPMVDGFDGYSEEAYVKFKRAAMVGATALNTNSKSGVSNSFALFITFKEGENVYLPQLDNYVAYEKIDGKSMIDVTLLNELLSPFQDQIESIEYYADPFKIEFKGNENDVKNIYTSEFL
ncbi:type I CRISPR-associated protein Cas7 [Sporolactobacillus sp. STCC-11]|uniref:type I CRISPR-associated protein Cas7 n=1 Tax=Sporolactobacillus caesalpiniae TaxID=3230362 RepID=UPI0033979149